MSSRGGIHFCVHWPTAVQPLVEQVYHPMTSFGPKKCMLEKVGIREKIPTGGLSLSLSTPRSFLHLPTVAAAISLLMQCLPILFNHFSYFNQPLLFLFLDFFFLFFLKGELSGSPMPPLFGLGQSPPTSWLSTSEVSCDPFLSLVLIIYLLITWIVLSVPLSKSAILVD